MREQDMDTDEQVKTNDATSLQKQVGDELKILAGSKITNEIVKATGVDRSYLWHVFRGGRNLTLGKLQQIAGGLGFGVRVFFYPLDDIRSSLFRRQK